jgi:hypothetical protein
MVRRESDDTVSDVRLEDVRDGRHCGWEKRKESHGLFWEIV